MNRRQASVALALVVAGTAAGLVAVETGLFGSFRWTRIPAITVVSAAGDPRIPLVHEAVDFWNRSFADVGTPFRLGAVTEVIGSVPDRDVQALSEAILRHTWRPKMPPSLDGFPGDLLVILSDASFISFTARGDPRVVIGIKSRDDPPMTLPNVQRNVITHELGHAIGLDHDADPTLLMCGRPAPCRPDAFRSETARIFPLSAQEKARLLALYPAEWRAS